MSVCVVEDDDSTRAALARLLSAAGFRVRAFASAEEFLPSTGAAGCAVLDLALCGLGIQEALGAQVVPPALVFLSGEPDVRASVRALKAGAVDFLTKPVDGEQLVDAVRRGLAQHAAALKHAGEMRELRQRASTLTPREHEVMGLVAEGMPNKRAAALLGVREKTVKAHRANVMRKMRAVSLPDLVRMADRLSPHPAPLRSGRASSSAARCS